MDVFKKPTAIDEDIVKNLGPLTTLAGIWEGEEGIDISPSRTGPVATKFRERLTFKSVGPVVNGPQVLDGLRYAATAWPLGQEKPFHEEVGYWVMGSRFSSCHALLYCSSGCDGSGRWSSRPNSNCV